jgi:CubicO group peptidase (beta-lactamase class C family)
MASAIPQGRLSEVVRAARARTGVPAVAAGLVVRGEAELAADGPVDVATPFRVASITKWFTASLAALVLDLDEPLAGGASPRSLLSHTAGLRPESAEPLPGECRGLWSYSNAGYWVVGEACTEAAGLPFSEAMRLRLLAPLGLEATGFEQPPAAAEGHLQAGETGHRPAGALAYPVSRRPSGGLWSTVSDLLRFAAHQLGRSGPLSRGQLDALREPRAEALGGRYCLGCWRRELEGGRLAFDHEGSVGGYQSLFLLVPEEEAALVVLTNSWRGSGLIRHVVGELGLTPASTGPSQAETHPPQPGRYALGGSEALIETHRGLTRVSESEQDPLSGERVESPPYRLEPLGRGIYGYAGGLLMSHRADFPRPGVARLGWVALPRARS